MLNTDALDPLDQTPLRIAAAPTRGRKWRWVRVLLWIAASVITLAVLAVAAGVLGLRAAEKAALPVLDGDLHLPGLPGPGLKGLAAPVTVRRDAHGVPHIEAANEDDLFVAQGYVTAQDRLWQMDAFRRNANGDLAEILGPSLLAHDKSQRVLQFRNTAQRIYTNMPAADRARLDDYARGVNLFIDQHQNSLPAEFRLLFYRPQPWSGADSISVGLMMVETLDMHFDVKLTRERIAAKLHNPKLEGDLYPVGSWRDRAPTGVVVDLSQPHPEPPATDSDDDDENTQASVRPADGKVPSRAKAHIDFAALTARLKSCPDTNRSRSTGLSRNTDRSRNKATPQSVQAQDPSSALAARLKPGFFKTEPALDAKSSPGPEDLKVLHELLGLPACEGCAPGSNNWVIAGKHTASGKPLLSNDMHLGLNEPNIWYMADLRARGNSGAGSNDGANGSGGAPGFHAAGVTLPGFPFVVAGHNEHVAWGFTALYADVQDLYIEKLDGKGNYMAPDGSWKPLTVDHETIHVRGGRDVQIDVQSTGHGPLVNPLFNKETRPIALQWTLYDSALNTIPIYQIDSASNWTEFSAALGIWCWPMQNVVYSDDQGHIAYQAVGRVPLRPAGLQGVPVQDGENGNGGHEWQGYIPFDAMPSAVDPPSGFLATANSRVTTEKSPYPLTLEWISPYRTERIYKALQGRDQLKPADMLAVQTDIYSEVDQGLGHRFAYAIDHTPGADDRLKKAADLMRSWDGRLATDSAAASIVTRTRQALWPLILEPKLGKDAAAYSWAESSFAEEEIVMHANPDWLPPAYRNWDALLTEAVRKGMENGKAPGDVALWTYGSWHTLDIEHPLAGFLPVISRIAGTGPQPMSGDTTTVKQVGSDFGPSQRFTMDWSNIDGSTENIVLGESGDPLSPYFRDQWNDWYGGTTFALPFTPPAVARETLHTLRLLP